MLKFKINNNLFELNTSTNKINPLTKIYRKLDFNNEPFKSIKNNSYITNIKGNKEFNLNNFKNKLK